MSDFSTKSEEYKQIIRDIVVPSTPFCCLVIATTLFSYKMISGKYCLLSIYIFFILFIISLILTFSSYRKCYSNKKKAILSFTFILFTCTLTGYYLTRKINNLIADNNCPLYIENTDIIIDEINFKRYSSEIYFTVNINNVNHLRGVIFYQDDPSFNKGDIIFIHKKIKKITSCNTYNKMLISKGIHFAGSINESDITLIHKEPPAFHATLQSKMLGRTDKIFRETTGGLIKALFTGNQNYIEKKIIIQYRNSGVLHVLSASGLHVVIFASIPAFFLIPIIRKKTAMAVSLLSVLTYLLITDMPVSLLRAVIMFALFYVNLLLNRQKNIFNYLMITCSIILIISPWEIFSPGFQLSFAATAGIIIFYKPFRKAFNGLPGIIGDTTAVTLAAQLTTLPIILIQMNQINTAGIISNLIIVPVITLIMGIALLALCVSFFSVTLAVILADITDIIFRLSLMFTDYISALKLNFFVYDISIVLIILLIIGALPLLNYKKIRKLKYTPVLLSVILCTIYLKKFYSDKNGEFTIKSGNSIAEVITENDRHVLKLNLAEEADGQEFITLIKNRNPDIKIIELENANYTSLLVSKVIMNDFIIDEFRFNKIPEIYLIKKTLAQLDKDKVTIKFSMNKLNFREKT